ncbi:DNA primase, UL52/UL70 type, Herpesviridae [Phytophthora cinnamomi]|uniref:DNA primase, UL52/UL70 type, Herpesviridae n=1 Tax=Phytophthora cinnamomi TaxID=4785 RepID=UPI00355A0431|nr:DNA primase, UL52/UL70 type, Herpesviridae [Phytophthora cinnamomi]
MTQVFESEACRVWTGALGAPLHAIEDAEQHELDVLPFSIQIWLSARPDTTPEGLYLVKNREVGVNSTQLLQNSIGSLFLPGAALSCFSLYSPSPFVSSVLVVLDVDDTRQQGYFFGRVRRAVLRPEAIGEAAPTDEEGSGSGAFYDTEVAEELLAALHTAFPRVPLSSSAKECLAKREMSRRSAGASKLGEMVKRRKTLSAEAFYGVRTLKSELPGPSDDRVSNSSWRLFYEKLQFRVSHSLMCQLEGTAPISSSFPRQYEAFEFADQVAALRRRLKTTGHHDDHVPRVFSFESVGDGKRRFLVANFAEFWKNYKKTRVDQRHVYEIIREGTPCRLYFDLEFKRAINPHVDGDSLVARLVSLLQLQLYRRYGIHARSGGIYQLDSSTPAKFSRHLIFHLPDGALFVDNLHAGAFVREFISDLVAFGDTSTENPEAHDLYTPFLINMERQDDPVDKKQLFIDTGVYTRNRMFRVLGSSKFKKQAILRPINELHSTPSELDQELFVNTLGEIRAIQMLMTNSLAMLAVLPGQHLDQEQPEDTATATQAYPWMIIYHMARNRCAFSIRSVMIQLVKQLTSGHHRNRFLLT